MLRPGELLVDGDTKDDWLIHLSQCCGPKEENRVGWVPLSRDGHCFALFDGSNVTFHLSAQVFILCRSLFRLAGVALLSSAVLTSAKKVESSA